MDNAGYVLLTRQSGLLDQLDVIATNIANAETTGYRREATMFSEFVKAVGGGSDSVSMATLKGRYADMAQGVLEQTGGQFDIAIEGDGFFLVQTPDGDRLTRSGAFTTNPEGVLVTLEGHPVLDEGGAQIFIPPDAANIQIGLDGTLSTNGQQIGRIAVVTVEDPAALRRASGTQLIADAPLIPVEDVRVAQGFLEASNVNPLLELTALIDVQRAYELGQSLAEKEAERIQQAIRTLGRAT